MKASSTTLIAGTDVSDLTELPLDRLADVANEAREIALNSAARTIEAVIQCGRALQEAKNRIGHGGWMAWLRKNFDESPDTAGRWIRIAANSARVPNLKEAKSIRAALRMIHEHDEPADDAAEEFRDHHTEQTEQPPELVAASSPRRATGGDGVSAIAASSPPDATASPLPTERLKQSAPATTTTGSIDGTQRAAEASTATLVKPTQRQQRFHDEFRKVLNTGPKGRDKAQRILTECLHSLATTSSREDFHLGVRLVRELIATWAQKFGLPEAVEDQESGVHDTGNPEVTGD